MQQKPLTINQEKFAQEYILTGNASEAYRRAYPKSLKWKENAVVVAGSKLLAKGNVSVRVAELRAKGQEQFEIDINRLLQEQSRISYFDYRKMFGKDGKLLDPLKMPDDVAAVVSGVKVSRVKRGDDVEESVIELKFWNKNTSLDSLFKHKGLYEKDNKQKKTDLSELIEELQGKGLKL